MSAPSTPTALTSPPTLLSTDSIGRESESGSSGDAKSRSTLGKRDASLFWERDGQRMLTRSAYHDTGRLEDAMARWRQHLPSLLLVSGDFGSGKTYFLQYLKQAYFAVEPGPIPVPATCIMHIATETFSQTPMYGVRLALRALLLDLFNTLCPVEFAQPKPTLNPSILDNKEFDPKLRKLFMASVHIYEVERRRVMHALWALCTELGVKPEGLYLFNEVLDVDFPTMRIPDPSIKRSTHILALLLQSALSRKLIKFALFIDNLQYLDYLSWQYLKCLVDDCPYIFVCASTCLQEDYSHPNALISLAELCGRPYAQVLALPDVGAMEVREMLSIKIHRYKKYGMTNEISSKICAKIALYCKGNLHYTSMVINKVAALMSKIKDALTLLLRIDDSREFEEARLILDILETYNDRVATAMKLLSVYGDYTHINTLSAIQNTSGGPNDLLMSNMDFSQLESYFNEPLFMDFPIADGFPSRRFVFKNYRSRQLLKSMVTDEESQLLFRKAYGFLRGWNKFNRIFSITLATPAFPLLLCYFGKINNLDPQVYVPFVEQAFFFYYDLGSWPDALYYNECLKQALKKAPKLARLQARREAWLDAAVDVQTRLRIGDFQQRKEQCILALARTGVKRYSYPSIGWSLDYSWTSLQALAICQGLHLRAPVLGEAVAQYRRRCELESQLVTFAAYTDSMADHALSLYHLLHSAEKLRTVDVRFKVQALFLIAAYRCVVNRPWGQVMSVYRRMERMERTMPEIHGGEFLDDYYLSFAAACLELGFNSKCLECLSKVDRMEESQKRSEIWYLRSFFIINLGYTCTGSVEKRLAFAEAYLAIAYPKYPISWGICTSMAAIAACEAEFGNMDKALALIATSWTKFRIMLDLDNAGGGMLHPILFLRDVLFVYGCECARNIERKFDFDKLVFVCRRLAGEWRLVKEYEYLHFPIFLTAVKMYGHLYFATYLYERFHGVAKMGQLAELVEDLFANFRRISRRRPRGHPLPVVIERVMTAISTLYAGKRTQAYENFRRILEMKEVQCYPVLACVLQVRMELLRLLFPLSCGDGRLTLLPMQGRVFPRPGSGSPVTSWAAQLEEVQAGLRRLQFHSELHLLGVAAKYAPTGVPSRYGSPATSPYGIDGMVSGG